MIDITGKIGSMFPNEKPEWPMYSFDRAAHILWNTIANEMVKLGYSEDEIKQYLQSKSTRWALDGDLGDMLELVGQEYARKNIQRRQP